MKNERAERGKTERAERGKKGEIELIKTASKHFYRTPIGILPSVTTILDSVRKPGLEAWKEREPRWREISDHAADLGTRVHKAIERYLNLKLKTRQEEEAGREEREVEVEEVEVEEVEVEEVEVEEVEVEDEEIKNPFSAFLEWEAATGFEAVGVELGVWSEQGYAGSLDLLGYLDGRLYVVDLKTSRIIRPEHLLQVSAYRWAYEERSGERVQGLGVLRLDKDKNVKTKNVKTKTAVSGVEWREFSEAAYQEALQVFLSYCDRWHLAGSELLESELFRE